MFDTEESNTPVCVYWDSDSISWEKTLAYEGGF